MFCVPPPEQQSVVLCCIIYPMWKARQVFMRSTHDIPTPLQHETLPTCLPSLWFSNLISSDKDEACFLGSPRLQRWRAKCLELRMTWCIARRGVCRANPLWGRMELLKEEEKCKQHEASTGDSFQIKGRDLFKDAGIENLALDNMFMCMSYVLLCILKHTYMYGVL